jgi:hypothetical protein
MAIVLLIFAMVLCISGFELFSGTRNDGLCWVLLIGAVLCVVTLVVVSFAIISRRWRTALVCVAASAAGASWVIMSFAPGGDRIIARARAADGTDMCMIQKFTGDWGEPYRVSFYYRRRGSDWGWFYYEHEDTRWWFGNLRLTGDGKRVEVRRFVSPVAYFDLQTEAFTIVRINRTLTGAQRWMPSGWEPEDEVARR